MKYDFMQLLVAQARGSFLCWLQTNVGNNNNKYFIIQLLEETGKKAYHVWLRWGRVGYKGQTNLVAMGGDLDQAKQLFTKK